MPLRNHQQLSRDEARQILSYIPAHGREDWIRIGMALKSEFGDDGFSLFDEWSQTADNYNQQSVKAVWRSFKDGSITIGSLIHLAQENGYRRIESTRQSPAPKITKSPKPAKQSTGTYALQLWLAADSSDSYVGGHQYATDKGISWAAGAARGNASGSVIGKNSDCLIVPIRNIQTNRVQGVQCINPEGRKQTFGCVSGGALILGNTLNKSLTWYVCEGWASAVATVFHHAHGNGVCACAFGKSNLEKVARLIEEAHNPDVIRIQREQD